MNEEYERARASRLVAWFTGSGDVTTDMSTTLVVPCFNEAARLDTDLFVRHARADSLRFVFVDDGSHDGTHDVLLSMAGRAPDAISTLRLERNSGKAEAVRRGIEVGFQRQPSLIGYWDADLATPLEELPALIKHFETSADLQAVIGSRVKLMGRVITRNPVRHYAGRIFATAVSMTLGLPIYDTQCGAKVFRNNEWTLQLFTEPFLTRWIFDVEVVARLKHLTGARDGSEMARYLIEHPLMEWTDVPGGKVRLGDFARSAVDLARIRRRYLR